MKNSRMSRILALGLCGAFAAASACDSFVLSLSLAVPTLAEATDVRTAAMPEGARLEVDNENGSTRVTVDPEATEATVEITRIALATDQAAADALLEAIVVIVAEPTAEDNTLRIDAPQPDEATGTFGDLDVSFEDDELRITGLFQARLVAVVKLRITLPPGHAVDVVNTNGTIRAVNLDTDSTLEGRNGSIRVRDSSARLDIETYNGQVEVEEHIGTLEIVTHNGQVVVEEHSGSLDAETFNGQVEIELRALGTDDQIRGRTYNGTIRLELPRDVNAELVAETHNGIVLFDEDDFDGVTIVDQTFWSLEATLNAGGPLVEVQTFNGMIDIDGD